MKNWLFFAIIILMYACDSEVEVGAQNELIRIVYPDNLYRHNNPEGFVFDITRPPYNADPTGQEDCSEAFIRIYDEIVEGVRNAKESYRSTAPIIYLPVGTYKLTKTIIYSGEPFIKGGHEQITHIRFRGEHRDLVTIRLADHTPGFEKEANRPVISYGKQAEMNNQVSSNFFEDITINTGRGNPGAIALRFHGANNEAVRNVRIISEDGQGAIGLDMPIGACQGVYKNIEIEGFDYGIHVSHNLAKSLTFENIHLKNQNVAGFQLEESSVSILELNSENKVPAFQMIHSEGLAVILNSTFAGGNPELPAIDLQEGVLYARNVTTSGYGSAIKKGGGTAIDGPVIDDYVSEPVITLFEQQREMSLNLPIEDTPEYPWQEDPDQWVCVNDFGAKGDGIHDDTQAIQKAMRSGKQVVYFLPGLYLIDGTIEIPSSVDQVNFMFCMFKTGEQLQKTKDKPMFLISGEIESPLFMEDLFSRLLSDGLYVMIEHASRRTLVLKDFHAQRGRTYRNTVEGGKVFFENVSVRTHRTGLSKDHLAYNFRGQKVWIRYFDPEYSDPEMLVDNSQVWLLGFKTEGHTTSFKVINQGKLEILGGVVNSYGMRSHHPQHPVLVNDHSSVSAVFTTGGPSSGEGVYFKTLIQEIQRGDTAYLKWTDAYKRFGDQRIVPLYVGHETLPAKDELN